MPPRKRKCFDNLVGLLNPIQQHNVEGQAQVHHTAFFSNGASSSLINVSVPPKKRGQVELSSCPSTETIQQAKKDATDSVHTSKSGASAYLEPFREHEADFLSGFNRRQPAPFRCSECFCASLLCELCLIGSDKHMPFHRTEVWNGKFFSQAPLASLGHVISFHKGLLLCPERPRDWKPTNLAVIDVNGVHDVKICFCYYQSRPTIVQQLTYSRLWPATVGSPSTAFTFAVLEDFHHHTLTSRKSAHDYWQTLCRKAVLTQNILKFKHMVITGIMAVVCEHDCFRPGGQNDLQLGEKFANADYALHGALTWLPIPDKVTHTYDIVCQYSKNIQTRWSKHFLKDVPLLDRLVHSIPKKHIVGHKEECQIRYSCNYLEGFGCVYGEGIEAIWAEDNQQSSSLQEMNAGSRHEVTEDNHMDWNSRKVQRLLLSRTTFQQFIQGLEHYQEAVGGTWIQALMRFTRVFGLVFIRPSTKKAQIYQKLNNQEIANEGTALSSEDESVPLHGHVRLIHTGIQLQQAQRALICKAEEANETGNLDKLEAARLRLTHDIARWRKFRKCCIPDLNYEDEGPEDIDSDSPESEVLGLPSDYPTTAQRKETGLQAFVSLEIQLRTGQADDALETLREAIRVESTLITQKKIHARGIGPNTRAENQIRQAFKKDPRQDALFAENFAPINIESNLWMKNSMKTLELGDGKRVEPWFWKKGLSKYSLNSNDWLLEIDRTRWFKSRTLMLRWREELNMRKADFGRLLKAFTRMGQAWTSVADSASANETTTILDVHAKKAYAYKMANYFEQKANETSSLFDKVLEAEMTTNIDLQHPE
ncbi:hypothetical protein M422DRAFT_274265 [Sphaerobolus stellatus SS14]|uniref:CxC2-like cysteine cluster KDZ transposase-associated domain-containing protein n=1 Tax=Sphaerobolus stellatus (strain SS14) TaxID=990650 RepID=A0A0C9UHJ8_SPHS4|nr:hypothetical protein M422DRAFT_274265 [Sphaerobolus stellatus SS14]